MKQLSIFLVLFCLSACNPFRQVFKTSDKASLKSVETTDRSFSKTLDRQDHSVIITHTKTAKTTELPAFKGHQIVNPSGVNLFDLLLKGVVLYRDSMFSVHAQLDSSTNEIKTSIESKGGKTTEESEVSVSENKNVKEQGKVDEKEETGSSEERKTQAAAVEKKPMEVDWFLILSILVIVVFLWFSSKKIMK